MNWNHRTVIRVASFATVASAPDESIERIARRAG
jgi:hypothetical protein